MTTTVLENRAKTESVFPVMEIFGPTIQGEGSVIGEKTSFVRFGGCDYRCGKCDSLHAVIPELVAQHKRAMTIQEIANEVCSIPNTPWVTLTGGNPVMWDLTELVSHLQSAGKYVTLETQGSVFRPWVTDCDQITISPKGPGMENTFPTDFDQLARWVKTLALVDHQSWSIKVVAMTVADLEFAIEVMQFVDKLCIANASIPPECFLSLGNPFPPSPQELTDPIPSTSKPKPSIDILELLSHYKIMTEEILQNPHLSEFRVTPQMHVLLWGNEKGK